MMWVFVLSATEQGQADLLEVREKGEINWSKGYVVARGYGFVDPKKPRGQARLLAERAAVLDARRNLLEIVKGVRITSETVVEDYMTESDLVYQRVEGLVKGARVIGKPKYYRDGRVEVKVVLYLDSLAKEFGPREEPKQPKGDASPPPKDVKGVIIKTPSGLKTCLYPRIVDEKGNVLLDFSQYEEVQNAWSKAVKFVKGKISKNTEGQIVIEASEVRGCDIVVKDKQQETLENVKKWAKYLFEAGKFIIDVLK